jgi:hypothetical protein
VPTKVRATELVEALASAETVVTAPVPPTIFASMNGVAGHVSAKVIVTRAALLRIYK